KIRNEVDKKLFQARVTSLEQLLSTVWNGTDYVYIHNPFHFLFFFQKTGKYANFSVVICVYASFFALLLFIWLFFSYNRKGMSEGENI
ncbi:hypothetical protein FZM88_09460, partial [Enterococcus faecium]|nr:hypothetical protein [Enterococcus faecium]MCZ1500731.1 hypothetical protein [Enterococcus faecium]